MVQIKKRAKLKGKKSNHVNLLGSPKHKNKYIDNRDCKIVINKVN